MAEVKVIPKIQCDNCGFMEEKQAFDNFGKTDPVYRKPKTWGGCHIEGSKDADAYGNKTRLDMSDLCPTCASVIVDVASKAMFKLRFKLGMEEGNDKTNGTE